MMMKEMTKAIQITSRIAHPRTGASPTNMKAIQMTAKAIQTTARKMAQAIHT